MKEVDWKWLLKFVAWCLLWIALLPPAMALGAKYVAWAFKVIR